MDAHTPSSLPHEDTEVRPHSHHNLEIPLNPQWEPPPTPLTLYLLLLEISVCVLKESLFYLFTLPDPTNVPQAKVVSVHRCKRSQGPMDPSKHIHQCLRLLPLKAGKSVRPGPQLDWCRGHSGSISTAASGQTGRSGSGLGTLSEEGRAGGSRKSTEPGVRIQPPPTNYEPWQVLQTS